MSLRTRTILIVSAIALVALAGVSVTLRIVLLGGVYRDQEAEAAQAMMRVESLTSQYLTGLERSARSLANQEESYALIAGDTSAYDDVSNTATFETLAVNMIAVADGQGRVVHGEIHTPENDAIFPLFAALLEHHVGSGGAFGLQGQGTPGASGFVTTPRGITAFASWPVLQPDGAEAGSVLVGAPFPPLRLPIADLIGGELSVTPIAEIIAASQDAAMLEDLSSSNEEMITSNSTGKTMVSWIANDAYGQPQALVAIVLPSQAITHVMQALKAAVLTMLVAGVIAAVVFITTLARSVTGPVRAIASQVRTIATTSDTSLRVRGTPGEIGILADSVNAMLASLDESRTSERALTKRLVDAEEAQRREIAKELHDEIGQALTGLKLMLEAASDGDQTSSPHIEEAQALVASLMTQVRDISLQLRPSILDDMGVVPALTWLIERYEQQTPVRVRFLHHDADRRMSRSVETTVYRIVQEALTNVARHSGAFAATVDLAINEGALRLHVQDDGRGFDLSRADASDHIGLRGMRERATSVGGTLTVDTVPGDGTLLTLEIPFANIDGDA